MSSFVMACDKPTMTVNDFDLWDVIDKLDDTVKWSSDEKPHPIADDIRWVSKIADQVGFMSADNYPVTWEGSGCSIIYRYKEPEKCAEGFRDFEYVAFLSLHYEYTIIIGIPNDMALLQFYHLVRPMLMLQSEKRFQDHNDDEYQWSRGIPQKKMYYELLANWETRQAKKTREENS